MKIQSFLVSSMLLSTLFGKAQTSSVFTGSEFDRGTGKIESKKNVVTLKSDKDKHAVTIRSHRSEAVQLYIFDLEGTILHQSILKHGEKHRVENLAKGTYTYTIFSKDESVEEGQLIIK